MLRGFVITLVLASGCAKLDLPPEPPAEGAACTSVALDGASGAAATIDARLGATDVCLELDASHNLGSAHLAITIAGANLHTTLLDADGTVLRQGWDVEVSGQTPRHTLEYTIEAGEIRDVVLHVTRTGSAAPAQISASLFEPLE